jgi:excinuclease ABC subunit C
MGVCRGNIPAEEYRETVRQAVRYIQGGSAQAVAQLQEQMQQASERLEFETAARCRDRLQAIERFAERQRVVYEGVGDQDVLSFVQSGDEISLSVLKFRGQKLFDKMDFLFSAAETVEETRSSFISGYYGVSGHETPPQLTVDEAPADKELLERLLFERTGKKIAVVTPKHGDKLRLVEMARANAAEQLSQRAQCTGREVAALDELAKLLGLPKPPARRSKRNDVTNIGSAVFVGAMAVFADGRSQKSQYKRFRMRDVATPDDYACMRRCLTRRFENYLEKSDESFSALPDLVLVDGGRGHVSAAHARARSAGDFGPGIRHVSRNDRHRTRAVTSEGGEIAISPTRSAYTLISAIQEDVHRFAVRYAAGAHTKRRRLRLR